MLATVKVVAIATGIVFNIEFRKSEFAIFFCLVLCEKSEFRDGETVKQITDAGPGICMAADQLAANLQILTYP